MKIKDIFKSRYSEWILKNTEVKNEEFITYSNLYMIDQFDNIENEMPISTGIYRDVVYQTWVKYNKKTGKEKHKTISFVKDINLKNN